MTFLVIHQIGKTQKCGKSIQEEGKELYWPLPISPGRNAPLHGTASVIERPLSFTSVSHQPKTSGTNIWSETELNAWWQGYRLNNLFWVYWRHFPRSNKWTRGGFTFRSRIGKDNRDVDLSFDAKALPELDVFSKKGADRKPRMSGTLVKFGNASIVGMGVFYFLPDLTNSVLGARDLQILRPCQRIELPESRELHQTMLWIGIIKHIPSLWSCLIPPAEHYWHCQSPAWALFFWNEVLSAGAGLRIRAKDF